MGRGSLTLIVFGCRCGFVWHEYGPGQSGVEDLNRRRGICPRCFEHGEDISGRTWKVLYERHLNPPPELLPAPETGFQRLVRAISSGLRSHD